jgi:hypothetical protein
VAESIEAQAGRAGKATQEVIGAPFSLRISGVTDIATPKIELVPPEPM